ncbi:MAG: DNA primase, partial [Planctomycetales bacterium]|nr:DNA primase [Planctomycetales bacterium]
MATVPVDVKEQVKQSIDIVDLIGGHLSLQRKGRKFVAHCPWHDDRRPSLQIDPERQSFKCFVCDIGGDVFSFVMRMENVEFREALSLLAERAGISLGGSRGAPSEKLREVRDVVAWARERFHEFLLCDSAAEPARRYLAERRIKPETWQQFQLGFSPPSWDWLLRAGQRASLAPEALESVGLVVRREDTGRVYDRFRGRLLFPICDQRGIPVGFGGRVLPALVAEQGEATGAKYINSPESPLFTKSKLLYALDAAHREFQARRESIVVEGYTDCLMAHQFGIRNTVAVLGTALGGEHIRLLRRLVDRVVLVLDGDAAGQRRTNEVLNLFVAAKFDLRVATLPEGLDPCDFLVQRGPDAFRELIESAHDALDHKIAAELTAVRGQDSVHASQQAVENILATLAMVEPGGDAEATAT